MAKMVMTISPMVKALEESTSMATMAMTRLITSTIKLEAGTRKFMAEKVMIMLKLAMLLTHTFSERTAAILFQVWAPLKDGPVIIKL